MVTSLIFWIVPSLLSLVDKPTMAVSLNKSSDECNLPLGVGDRQIADSQLTSPAFVSHLYIAKEDIYINAKPNYGRLNRKYSFCGRRFSYLQVNLSYVVNVTAVATQGLDDWVPSFVKTYRLRFSLNGQDWFNYSTPNKVWRGNINGRGIKRNNFNSSIQTQYLRFYPQRYNYERCLRVEVYGCKSSDPDNGKFTPAKTDATSPVDDGKFTPMKTSATTPIDDVKVTPTEVLKHVNNTKVTETLVGADDVVSQTNVALVLGLCIGCFALVALTIFVFFLLKRKAAAKKPEAFYRLVKKELV
ncbi:EGF-like repeat and discoidin I-like domain-containing protein 3 isoform X5 [Xenia sp. Carnegie-2017]|uniref:EGF-like repeat and discoidin I-like domain-containing protein 3 isoform X5 n=1 Tax=Xenia sp. Carnegie-2017 TaxID=2897299 RepID=UPI001F04D13D|nr:EGF-like repeat and discoidin I-like domain-containing protein 3 isoform X5 [Xenia sp. Carnegie-2017]